MIGFGDAADSGPELLALLDAAPPAASAPQASPAPRQAIDAPLVGTLSVAQLGLPLFTTVSYDVRDDNERRNVTDRFLL